MMWLSFAQLALATPVLTVTGDCPGPATIDMTEISAFGTAALLVGSGPGSEVVPAGPCAGIPTGLADVGLARLKTDTEGDGMLRLRPTLSAPSCGRSIQVLDIDSCELSEVVPLGATEGDGCAPLSNAVQNPSFEEGASVNWVSNGVIYEGPGLLGDLSGQTQGNYYMEQTFDAVPVSELTEASWAMQFSTSCTISSIHWGYTDGTEGDYFWFAPSAEEWHVIDVLAEMDPTKSVNMVRVWGCSGGGEDIVDRDDFRFCY